MKKIKIKVLSIISSGLFLMAIQSVNSVSSFHNFQDKEPNGLKKYEKN